MNRLWCEACGMPCEADYEDFGFSFDGPSGRGDVENWQWASRCCGARVLDSAPGCDVCRESEPAPYGDAGLEGLGSIECSVCGRCQEVELAGGAA